MKKSIRLFLLVPAIFFLVFIAIDQYTKYALKTATIKFTKEYCNEDITVREVEIKRIDLSFSNVLNWGSNFQWVVEATPSNYGIKGKIWEDSYVTSRSGDCLREIKKSFKLNRIKREFVPW